MDDRGYTQVRAVFDTVGWTVNRIEHDYGIDYEVEVFRHGKSTGITFKAQLKSSENSAYSADRTFVSQSLGVPQARYLTEELRVPVLLLHADVVAGKTYWAAPQLDSDLDKRLATLDDASEITIRVPTTNSLPETLDVLAETVAKVETLLAARVVATTPVPRFVAAVDRQTLREDTIRGLQEKVEALRLDEGHRLLLAGKLDEASGYIAAILGDASASMEAKFSAILIDEMIQAERLTHAPGGDEAYHRMMLTTAVRLRTLTRKGPTHLKFFALIQKKAAELDVVDPPGLGHVHDAQGSAA